MFTRITALFLVAVLSVGSTSAAEYEFQVIDVPGALRTEAYDINDAGQVAGFYSAYDGFHGFVLDGTGLTVIDVPPGPNTEAFGINNLGKIVGHAAPDSFLKDGASVEILRYPGSLRDPSTIAIGINDLDHVVGRYIDSDSHGFIKVGPAYTRVAVPGAVLTELTGINNSGDIVGSYALSGGVSESFLLRGGDLQVVAVPSASLTAAHGINSAGQISGTFLGDGKVAHGFVRSCASVSVIDVPGATAPNYTQVRGINDLGQVVGRFDDSAGTHGFVATPVSPVQLKSLTLRTSEIAGCKTVSGTVTLAKPAPPEGVNVTLCDTLVSATVPVTLKVLPGAASKSFTVKSVAVSAAESGSVSATLGGVMLSQPLTVRPMGLASLKLAPTTVVGGQPSTGTATLECTAGPGPVTVDLSTSNAAIAAPVAPTVVVPQGIKSQTFTVATNPVLSRSSAMITGEASTTTKSRRLTVVPAASVSPTRLAFGTQAVGTTSAALSAVLRNDGVAPFAVNGISLTGTYASWFSQSNNCPANLAAGASCTISVRFAPQAALSKSAKLSIATSATSTPLSVSLSGTGT